MTEGQVTVEIARTEPDVYELCVSINLGHLTDLGVPLRLV
jgi:hypothetical protein